MPWAECLFSTGKSLLSGAGGFYVYLIMAFSVLSTNAAGVKPNFDSGAVEPVK